MRLFALSAAVCFALVAASVSNAALPRTMAAIGDSLSNGYAATGGGFPNPSASWSTGTRTDVNSHRKRIQAAGNGQMAWAKTYARSGTLAFQKGRPDLATQAKQVPIGTAYVTVSIANGDICSKHVDTREKLQNRVSRVGDGLRDALRTLFNRNPQARVLVMSVPNWHELWMDHAGTPGFQSNWDRTGSCPLLFPTTATQEQRDAVNFAIQDANALLEGACSNDSRCTFDGGASYGIGWADPAWLSSRDSFHFSTSGNDKIADLTWGHVPFRNDTNYAKLNLRIVATGARKIRGQRVRASFDTFPDASASIRIRKNGRTIGSASGRADGDGDFARRIGVSTTSGRMTVVMKASSRGQRETKKIQIG